VSRLFKYNSIADHILSVLGVALVVMFLVVVFGTH